MDNLLQTIISEFSRKALKTLSIPSGFFISHYMTPPRGLSGSQRGGRSPPQLGPYEWGDGCYILGKYIKQIKSPIILFSALQLDGLNSS